MPTAYHDPFPSPNELSWMSLSTLKKISSRQNYFSFAFHLRNFLTSRLSLVPSTDAILLHGSSQNPYVRISYQLSRAFSVPSSYQIIYSTPSIVIHRFYAPQNPPHNTHATETIFYSFLNSTFYYGRQTGLINFYWINELRKETVPYCSTLANVNTQ